jgi:hypothetical protein
MKIYSQFIITEDEEQQSGAHFTKTTIEADVVWPNTNLERDCAFGGLSEVAPPSLRRPMPASGASLPAKAASTAPAASSGTVAMLPSSPSATATATPSALPSWIARLSNASIAADMTAADVNGSVSYAGLQKLLVDLDSTVVSSNMGLTSAELSDLKTIVANLNNGMTTSSYLTWVMNALVNGNASNATWTGGAASSTNLGNLASGSSATQLSELIGKWFLGTDLPSSKVSMSGYSSFSVSSRIPQIRCSRRPARA